MKIKHIFLFGFILICQDIYAQVKVPAHISQKLRGDTRFNSFASEMTGYLDSVIANATDSNEIKAAQKQYKFLARRLYYLENHQDAEGKIVNASVKNYDELKSLQLSQENSTEAANGSWTTIGPDFINPSFGTKGIGRVDRIAFHPTLPNTVYAGTTSGGLFRTTSGGTVWSNVNEYIPSLGISGIVVSHANASTLYVLTGDGDSNLGEFGFVEGFNYIRPSIGVLKSTDEGQSWQRTNLDIPGFYVGYKLIQSPADANVLLAATSKGLYRTADGGNNWNLVSSDSSRYYDIEWKPGSSVQAYAVTANRFFMTVSSGQTWADLTNRLPDDISNYQRISLAVTPANAGMLYVLAGRDVSQTSTNYKIFRSSSSASIFAKVYDQTFAEGSAMYMLNIAASTTNHLEIVFGGLRCHYSTNGGESFIRVSQPNDSEVDTYVHADIHELTYNPHTGDLFIGSDGGVFTTSSHGVSHFGRYLGFSATQYYHFDINEANADFMLAGAQDNGIMLKDDNTSFFKNYKDGDGFSIAYPHGYGTSVVVTINTNTYLLLKDFPSTFWILNNIQNNVWYKPVAYSYYDSAKYIGGLTKILKWTTLNSVSEYDGSGCWALTTCKSNSNRLYAAGGTSWNSSGDNSTKDFIRSDDNAVTWTSLKGSAGFPAAITKITSIAVHPNNSSIVYFTMGGYAAGQKIFYSSNAGATWSNRSGNLPNIPVNSIVVQSNGDAYIGTDIGVFYSSSIGTDWVPFFNGLPKIPVTDLKIHSGRLFASTFGRGIWKTDLATACPSAINISLNQSGRIFYEAGTINSTAELVDGAGTEIYMKAQTQTVLSPGFRANARTGEEFRSWVGNCGAGGVPLRTVLNELENLAPISCEASILKLDLANGSLLTFIALDASGEITGESYEAKVQASEKVYQLPAGINHPRLLIIVDGKKAGILFHTIDGYVSRK